MRLVGGPSWSGTCIADTGFRLLARLRRVGGLDRLDRCNEAPVDAGLLAPGRQGIAGELRAVVGDNRARLAAPLDFSFRTRASVLRPRRSHRTAADQRSSRRPGPHRDRELRQARCDST